MERNYYVDLLENLAAKQLQLAEAWITEVPLTGRASLLIEIFRVLDFLHVHKAFDQRFDEHFNFPSFDIMLKGLNSAVHYLLPSLTGFEGIPMVESTEQTYDNATAILYHFGIYNMLRRTIDMLKFDMVSIQSDGNDLIVTMTPQGEIDHFLDAVESKKFFKSVYVRYKGVKDVDIEAKNKIEELIKSLVRKWDTGSGIVIGYNTTPEIDRYFDELVFDILIEWRNSAGIHPTATFGNVSGTQLIIIGGILASIALKHMHFILLGVKEIPEANYLMSLTTWRNPTTLAESIHFISEIDLNIIKEALKIFTVKSTDSEYFRHETTPYIPFLIEISSNYLLSPLACIFANPFNNVRKFGEHFSSVTQNSIKEPREKWMIMELAGLFGGDRYKVVEDTIDLKSSERFITDIDSAIWDNVSNELALFQLKWQDLDTHNIKSQRSKAKNFVTQVDEWVDKIENWISTHGLDKLLKRLHIETKSAVTVYLFAIGRNASRFRSYGYDLKQKNIATGSWLQFVRLRFQIGPVDNVFKRLSHELIEERNTSVNKQPIPHKVVVDNFIITYENMWYQFPD